MTRTLFEIEAAEHYPLPGNGNPYGFPFDTLNVGESFLVTDPTQMVAACKRMSRLNNASSKQFISRTMTTGRRFWRKR